MNLYKLHKDPKSLRNHDKAHDTVPELLRAAIIHRAPHSPAMELNRDQLKAVTQNIDLTWLYIKLVVQDVWPPGEDIISKTPMYAWWYVKDYLHKKWPKGEAVIGMHEDTKKQYNTFLIDKGYNEDELI